MSEVALKATSALDDIRAEARDEVRLCAMRLKEALGSAWRFDQATSKAVIRALANLWEAGETRGSVHGSPAETLALRVRVERLARFRDDVLAASRDIHRAEQMTKSARVARATAINNELEALERGE